MVWIMSDDNNHETQTEIDNSIIGTAKIDPDRYSSDVTNSTVFDRTKYAISGLLHLIARHVQFRYIVVITAVVIVLAAWLDVGAVQWALLVLAIGQLWIAEALNSGLEAVTDLTTEGDIRALAKVAKDVAAAATLIASLVLLAVTCFLLLPLFLEKF
jgi:diacylglycerol kinase